MIVREELLQSEPQLPHIVGALGLPRPVFCTEQGRKKQAKQNGNDCDNDQEFNQVECGLRGQLSPTCGAHGLLPLLNVRPEWRGAEHVKMQTGTSIPRPLQAACPAACVKYSWRDVWPQDAKQVERQHRADYGAHDGQRDLP